ncbi:unnamed protein product [Ilex paraguariensis]|uniref:Zinc finger CCCH domain-containing protein 16 n=1 Tax=Ilex paraguariensis TaxID=185542 RepID=A0ABC8TKF0_9AQUA
MQNGTQLERPNLQQQKPSPFGFGVQNNSQSRGSGDFGSKQNQFKPFENKWTRFSPINNGSSSALRQPDNQPSAPNHNCVDPESCKSQIKEDFEHERPLWKLTCYGHRKNGPCDIVGDISYEELRATAYDDAKRGLSLDLIVQRERSLLNSKLLEFERLLRNPYTVPSNSTLARQSFPGANPNSSQQAAQTNGPPSVSSFSQLGASLNTGFAVRPAALPNNAFGQPNNVFGQPNNAFGHPKPSQNFGQPSNVFGTSNFSFGNTAKPSHMEAPLPLAQQASAAVSQVLRIHFVLQLALILPLMLLHNQLSMSTL